MIEVGQWGHGEAGEDFIKLQNQCYRVDHPEQLRRESRKAEKGGLTLLVEMCLLSCSQNT